MSPAYHRTCSCQFQVFKMNISDTELCVCNDDGIDYLNHYRLIIFAIKNVPLPLEVT